jgi:stage IV sporulation protein FB
MAVNIWLLLFNLVPAFPMDGGRVLRALLAMRVGLTRATRVAASVGQVLALAMGLFGLSRGQPLLVLIAFFVFLGAGAEAASLATRTAGRGLSVRHMMVTDFKTLPVYATLADAVQLLLAGEQREFPVLDNWGRVEGILTRDDLIRGLTQRGPSSGVSAAMTVSAPAVPPELGFTEALERLKGSGLPALPVVDAAGALVGMLTLDNITDHLLVRRARGQVE